MKLIISEADLSNPNEASGMLDVLDSYASDPVGGGRPLDPSVRERLPAMLRDLETSLVLLAVADGQCVGVAVCFFGLSTFRARRPSHGTTQRLGIIRASQGSRADDFHGTAPRGTRYDKPTGEPTYDPNTKWFTDCRLDEADVRFFGPDVAVMYGAESKTVTLEDASQERRCLAWTDT